MNDEIYDIGILQESLFKKIEIILKSGITLYEINDFVEVFFYENKISIIPKTTPITLNVNNLVYHGLPSEQVLNDGDLITIDICFLWNESKIDGAATFCIGEVEKNKYDLVIVNKEALKSVTKIIDVGVSIKDILVFLSDYIGYRGYYMYPDGIGHGIGIKLHERPFLSLIDFADFNYILKEGDFFTIEPILFLHKDKILENNIGEGFIGPNNVSSQFEISIFVKAKGCIQVLNSGLINNH